jgi:hypothetical protein
MAAILPRSRHWLARVHPAAALHIFEIGTSVLATHRRYGAVAARVVAVAFAQRATSAELLFNPTDLAVAVLRGVLEVGIVRPALSGSLADADRRSTTISQGM